MTIHHRCIKCHWEFDLPDEVAGKKIRCHKCNQAQSIPVPEPAAEEVEEPVELHELPEGHSENHRSWMIPIIIATVLAIPVIGFGFWAILGSNSSETETTTELADGRQAGNQPNLPHEDGDPDIHQRAEHQIADNNDGVLPGKINVGNGANNASQELSSGEASQIEIGNFIVSNQNQLYDELSALGGSIGLNWIYMHPEGELASKGFPEIEHDEKVSDIYQLANKIRDRRLRKVVRDAALKLDLFPGEYTQIVGDGSLEGLIFDFLGQRIVQAQFLAMNTLLEQLHRDLWSDLDPVMQDLARGRSRSPEIFAARIPPVQNRGSKQVKAEMLLHNGLNQVLHDVVMRVKFRDPWGEEVQNWYYFDSWEAVEERTLMSGINWGPTGISRTIEAEFEVWSREAYAPAYKVEFEQNFRDAISQRLQVAENLLNNSGDYHSARRVAGDTFKVLKGDRNDEELRSLAESLNQRAAQMKSNHESLLTLIKPDTDLVGRWFFGRHSGDLGLSVVSREDSIERRGLLGLGRRSQVPTSSIEARLYDPASPPEFKEFRGKIGFHKARKNYVLGLSRNYSSGLERESSLSNERNLIGPDTRQLLLKSDERTLLFEADQSKGWLVSEDSLGTKEILIPKGSDQKLAELQQLEQWEDDYSDWQTMKPLPAEVLPPIKPVKPLSEEYRDHEMKRMHAVPPGEYAQYAVTPVGFFDKKFFAHSVTSGKIGISWDLETGIAEGQIRPAEGMILSPDDRWIGRLPHPNLISMKRSSAPAPDVNMTAIAFSPDSEQFFGGTNDGKIGGWEIGDREHFFEAAMTDEITALMLDEDDRLFAASDNQDVSYWELGRRKTEFVGTYSRHTGPVKAIQSSPNGPYALTIAHRDPKHDYSSRGDHVAELHVWDTENQKTLYSSKIGRQPTAFAISKDWRWLLLAEADNRIYLWNLETGREVDRFEGHLGYVSSLAFSPSNKFAISGSRDQWVILWGMPEEVWKTSAR